MLSLVPLKRNRFFPANINSMFDDPFFRFMDDTPSRTRDWVPAIEIIEDEKVYRFVMEVPGVDQKNLSISVENDVLTLSGEKVRHEHKDSENVRTERWYGQFTRSFSLPQSVDAAKISANLKNGILTITVPKRPEATPRKVDVTIG